MARPMANDQRRVTPIETESSGFAYGSCDVTAHTGVFANLQESLEEQMLLADARLIYLEERLARLLRHTSP